jgi:hypothetical protein
MEIWQIIKAVLFFIFEPISNFSDRGWIYIPIGAVLFIFLICFTYAVLQIHSKTVSIIITAEFVLCWMLLKYFYGN